MLREISKGILSFSAAVVGAGIISMSANAANQSKFDLTKHKLIHRTEIRIQKLENYKTCLKRTDNFKDIDRCKAKYIYHHHKKTAKTIKSKTITK